MEKEQDNKDQDFSWESFKGEDFEMPKVGYDDLYDDKECEEAYWKQFD